MKNIHPRGVGIVVILAVLQCAIGCGRQQPALPFAEATLEARPPVPGLPAISATDAEPRINTAIHTLQSDPVINGLLADSAVQATAWFKNFNGDMSGAAASLAGGVLQAEYLPGTTQLRLRVLAYPVSDSAVLLQAWINAYQAEIADHAASRYRDEYLAYEQQLETLRNEIDVKTQAMALQGVPEPESMTHEQRTLMRELDSLALRQSQAQAQMDEIVLLMTRAGSQRLEVVHPPTMVQP